MAMKTWVGGVSSDWFNPANWDGNAVPTASDIVIIAGAGVVVDVPDGQVAVFAQLTVSGGALLRDQGALQSTGLVVVETNAELRLDGGSITGATVQQQTGGVLTAPPGTFGGQNALNAVTLTGDLFAPGVIRLALDGATSTNRPDGILIDATDGGILTLHAAAAPFTVSQQILMTNIALGLDVPVSASGPNVVVAPSGVIAGSGTIFPDFSLFAFTTSDLKNLGTIESRAFGSRILNISTNAFENAGTLRATENSTLNIGGDFPLDASHVFKNLAGGVLTGGFYDIIAGATGPAAIAVNGNDPAGNPHTLSTLAAQISLTGLGSDFTVNGASIAGSLREIAETGQLNLFQRDFQAGATLTVSGFLNLQGSTVLGGGESILDLTVGNTGFVGGHGAVQGTVANNGSILAAGVPGSETLTLGGAVTGTGLLEVNGLSTLQIDGAVSVGQTMVFSDAVGFTSETLRLLSAIDTFDATISGFGTGDIIELEYGAATEAVVRAGQTNLLDVFNGSQLLGTLTFATDLTGQQFSVTAENDVDGEGYLITLGAPPFVPTYDGVWQVYGPDNFDYGSLFFGGTPLAVNLEDLGGGRQRFTADYAGGRRVVFEGENLSVDGANTPTGGKVDRIEVSNFDGTANTKLADFFSEPGSGHVMAVPFAAKLITDGGPDYLAQLLRGDNKFIGSPNDDTVQDDYGNNTFDGGDGYDTLVFGPKVTWAEVTSGDRPGDPLGKATILYIDDPAKQEPSAFERFFGPQLLDYIFKQYNDRHPPPGSPPPPPPSPPPTNDGGATGHPHIHAIDGGNLNFQAVGEFVLSRSTVVGETFEVQVRLGPIEGNAPISTVFAMAALVADGATQHKVTIDPARLGNALWVDGSPVTLNPGGQLDLGGATVTLDTVGRYLIAYDTGQTVTAQLYYYGVPHLDVVVSVPASRPDGTVEGLIGNDDGIYGNDFLKVDGSPVVTYEDYYGPGGYADRWRITDATSLFDYADGQNTETFTDRTFPGSVVTLADFPVDVINQAAALVAGAGITDAALLQDAILDYLLTGNIGFIQSAANLQAQGLTGDFNVSPPPPVPPKGVGVAALPAFVTEEAGATTTLSFKVFRIGDVTGAVDVSYAVVAAGDNFAGPTEFGGSLPTGTVTIAAGQQSATVTLEVSNAFSTATENVRLQLTGAINVAGAVNVLAPLADVTVTNADPVAGTAAQAQLIAVTNGLALTGSGQTYVLDLGTLTQGVDSPAATLALANVAPFGANTIGATFADDGAVTGFTFALPAVFTGLAPGGQKGFTIDANTTALGAYSEIITIDLSQGNATGFIGDLPTLTLTVLANIVAAVNNPPVAVNDTGATNEDTAVQFTAAALLANDSDPDNNPLTLTTVGNAVGGTVGLSAGIVTFTPTANFFGPASFDYTISDGQFSRTATVNVTVAPVNDEQTAPATNSVTTLEDAASAAVPIGAADIDGDPLIYAVKPSAGPAKGTVSFAGGSFVYTPLLNANGSDSFTILVDDGKGAVSEQVVSVTITPVNDEQTAPATNSVTTLEDTASVAIAIGAADIDGDPLTYAVKPTAAPTKGTVSFSGGNFVYTPLLNANGSDSFTILVDDGQGTVSEQVVSVTIMPVNDPASIVGTATGTVTEDGTLVASGDLDVIDPDTGQQQFQTATGLTGTFGSFTFVAATGAWTYTLANGSAAVQALNTGDVRTDTLTVLSLDGTASRTISVTINGANEPVGAIVGTARADRLNGTAGDDSIQALGGADTVSAGNGNDRIDAGTGNDSVNAGGGNDTVIATSGDGSDVYDGGAGIDLLDMSRLTVKAVVNLGDGFAVSSQTGADDVFRFENVTTGSGADVVFGSSAANVIDAGAGNDTMLGGGSTDSFVFHANNGRDVILDFRVTGASHDVLVFDEDQFASLAALAAATTATAQGTLIRIDADDSVLLAGVSKTAFLANLSTDVLLL